MKSDTWYAVANTLTGAWGGNQAALEATGGILASIILPGKKLPDGTVNTGKISAEKEALEKISQNSKNTANHNSKQNYSVLDQQASKSSVIIE